MGTMDLNHDLATSYTARRTPSWVGPPPGQFLMVDGQGDPNSVPEYPAGVQALFSVAYGLRFALKRAGVVDAKVLPLEGLWSLAGAAPNWAEAERSLWRWTMMIRVPDEVTADLVDTVREQVRAKAGASAQLDALRLDRYDEGLSAQVLHVGPYSSEGPTIEALHAFIHAAGRTLSGSHHEIYLGDPRRAAPERLRTILRQPVR